MKILDLFESKASKAEAGYQSKPKNGQKCINCTMWRDPNKCSAVAGNIDPNGWCDWYAGGAYGKHGKKVNEDGRIVKGVNTTVDVGPNEIKTQTAKFGNSVTKGGVPPTLSTKVKGKSTNVLFNLGLSESVTIQFERGATYDILHIKEKGKNRVEIRGKKGYESYGYDPKDKLHQTLDKLGKAANISDLMNGEPVVLNPKHPDGPKAIKTVQAEDAPRYTAHEWAIISGGHSLEDKPKTKLFDFGKY